MAKPINLDDRDEDEIFKLVITPNVGRVKRLRSLIEDYDVLLSTNNAILKLMDWAIKEHWIPGYERKEKVLDNANKKGYKVSKLESTEEASQ